MSQLNTQNLRKTEKIELEHQELDIEFEHEEKLIEQKRKELKERVQELKQLERQLEDEIMNCDYYNQVTLYASLNVFRPECQYARWLKKLRTSSLC